VVFDLFSSRKKQKEERQEGHSQKIWRKRQVINFMIEEELFQATGRNQNCKQQAAITSRSPGEILFFLQMREHIKATISDLRARVDKLVEVIDTLENLDAPEAQQVDITTQEAPSAVAVEPVGVVYVQSGDMEPPAPTKRQQAVIDPSTNKAVRDIGNDIPRMLRPRGSKAARMLVVTRLLNEPFSAAELARQSDLKPGSASNVLSQWAKKGWVETQVYGEWNRTSKFPAAPVYKANEQT
jgi:hypothetical protein